MSLLPERSRRDTLETMHRWRFAVMAVFGALALGGCLRFDANLVLSSDDTVTGKFIVAVKEGTGPQYGTTDRAMSEDIWAEYPVAMTLNDAAVTDYHGDGYAGIAVRFTDEPLASFAPTATAWGVTRVGEDFVVSGPSNATKTPTTGTSDAGTGDSGAFAGDLSQLSDADLKVAITFPGPVASANGTIQGRTVTWNLTDGPATLDARGAAVETDDPAVRMAYAVFALLALGAAAYALAGRLARRHT